MRCEKNDRAALLYQRWKGRGEKEREGVSEAVRFGSGHDTKATCSRSFQLSVKVRAFGVRKPLANFFECPESGSHRPRCPLCSYCDRISALFLPELQNVRTFSSANGGLHGWWVALALRAIEQRGYRAWLKASHPIPSSATAPATVEATKAGEG
ncbi:hypothetical protein ALC62_01083 [Cyphomyrmex costatus]|uniref:Uncharacterized protein n=1 Tax=Cyphomyrmex costatus TaxID=456900 RepID=A0A195D4X6_9HYME|nr:hypothetical protein ALC62_01083 [Cyphomyrmex costatus]